LRATLCGSWAGRGVRRPNAEMARVPGVNDEIVLVGSAAKVIGRTAGKFIVSTYAKHKAALVAGTHEHAEMQAEYDRLGGSGLLCRLIET